MYTSTLLAIAGIGPFELAVVSLVALLLFGSRLPAAMRSLGSGIKEFKNGLTGIENQVEEAGS
jgi:sec-independent protein translocase protein TatA